MLKSSPIFTVLEKNSTQIFNQRSICWFSSLFRGFFSWSSGFLPPQKTNILNSISTWRQWPTRGMYIAKLFNPISNYRYFCYFCMSHSSALLCSQHELLLVSFKFLNFYSDSPLLYLCYVSDSPINNQNYFERVFSEV